MMTFLRWATILSLLAFASSTIGTARSADKKGKSKAPAAEAAESPDPEGIWPKYKAGQAKRYMVFHDSAGWHVRVTSSSRAVFTGKIKVEGGRVLKITGFENLEVNPNKKDADAGTVSPDRTKVTFRFVTSAKEDAFDFTVSEKATELEFTLRIDNADQPEHIFVGRNGQHPKSVTFKVPAHPEKKE